MGTPWGRGPVHIYTLRAPDSAEVRYVGATSRPAGRAAAHRCRGSNNCAPRLREWLDGLHMRGLLPVMETVEIWHDERGARDAERFAVGRYMAAGHALLNQAMVHPRNRGRGPIACEGPALLRAWMQLHGVTQFALARRLGVKQGAVSFWLCLMRVPRVELALRIESLTGVAVSAWQPLEMGAA